MMPTPYWPAWLEVANAFMRVFCVYAMARVIIEATRVIDQIRRKR